MQSKSRLDALSAREPEMEAFLLRLVPGLESAWEGASPEEIRLIQGFVGKELPRFYRWFLSKAGGDAGPLPGLWHDLAVKKVIRIYQEEDLGFSPDELFIGQFDRGLVPEDDFPPVDLWYQLNTPLMDDARVNLSLSLGQKRFYHTLREYLAWHTLREVVIYRSPHRCEGTFSGEKELSEKLISILKSLGLTRSVAGSPTCAVFEGSDAALAWTDSSSDNQTVCSFDLGGPSEAKLRQILDGIKANTLIQVNARWIPRTQ